MKKKKTVILILLLLVCGITFGALKMSGKISQKQQKGTVDPGVQNTTEKNDDQQAKDNQNELENKIDDELAKNSAKDDTKKSPKGKDTSKQDSASGAAVETTGGGIVVEPPKENKQSYFEDDDYDVTQPRIVNFDNGSLYIGYAQGTAPSINLEDGKIVISDSNLENSGFVHAGWSTKSNYIPGVDSPDDYYQEMVAYDFDSTSDPNLTLYPVWIKASDAIAVNFTGSKDGEDDTNSNYSFYYPANMNVQMINLSDSWSKKGYNLVGYNDGTSEFAIGSLGDIPIQSAGSSITYSPMWEAKVYTINYYDAGEGNRAFSGNLATPNPISYTYGTTDVAIQTPTKAGYEFFAWNTNPSIPCTYFIELPYESVNRISSTTASGVLNPADAADENNVVNLYAHWERAKLVIIDAAEHFVKTSDLTNMSWSMDAGSDFGESISNLNLAEDDLIIVDQYGIEHRLLSYEDEMFMFDGNPFYLDSVLTVANALDMYIKSGTRVDDAAVKQSFANNGSLAFYTGDNGVDDVYAVLPMYDNGNYKTSIPAIEDSLEYVFKGYSLNQNGTNVLLNYDKISKTFSFAKAIEGYTDGTNWTLGGDLSRKEVYPILEKISKEFYISGNRTTKFIGHKDESGLLEWAASEYNNEETNACKRKLCFIYDEQMKAYFLGYFEEEFEPEFEKQNFTIADIDVYKPYDKAFYSFRYIYEISGALYTYDGAPVAEGEIPEGGIDIILPGNINNIYAQDVNPTYGFGHRSSILDFYIDGINCQTLYEAPDYQYADLRNWARDYASTTTHGLGRDIVWIDIEGTEYLGYFDVGSGVDKGTSSAGIEEYSIPQTDTYSLYYIDNPDAYAQIADGQNLQLIHKERMHEFTIGTVGCKTGNDDLDLISWGKKYSQNQFGKELIFIEQNGKLYLGFDYLGKLHYQDYDVNGIKVYKADETKGYSYSYIDGDVNLVEPEYTGSAPASVPQVLLPAGWDDLTQNNEFALTNKDNTIRFKIGTEECISGPDATSLVDWVSSDYNDAGYYWLSVYSSLGTRYFALTKEQMSATELDFTINGSQVYYSATTDKTTVGIISGPAIDLNLLLAAQEVLPDTYASSSALYNSDQITDGYEFEINRDYYNCYSTCLLGDTLITMADGSKREVSSLSMDDLTK